MKDFVKGTILGGIVVFLLILSVFIYKVKFSNAAKKAKENILNSKKIFVGMDAKEVVKIMGHPKKSYNSYSEDAKTIYFYEPPFLSSSGIEIYLDKNYKVVRVIYSE